MIMRLKYLLLFLRSTLKIGFFFVVFITLLVWPVSKTLGHALKTSLQYYPFITTALCYFYKQAVVPDEYYFYYNARLGKIQLWVFVFVVSYVVCFFLQNLIYRYLCN